LILNIQRNESWLDVAHNMFWTERIAYSGRDLTWLITYCWCDSFRCVLDVNYSDVFLTWLIQMYSWRDPPKKLLGSGFSTPYTPRAFCLICTISSELKGISHLYPLSEPGLISKFSVDGFDTSWIPISFSCGYSDVFLTWLIQMDFWRDSYIFLKYIKCQEMTATHCNTL